MSSVHILKCFRANKIDPNDNTQRRYWNPIMKRSHDFKARAKSVERDNHRSNKIESIESELSTILTV